MKLSGKTAIVTGSAHRVGKGIALELARKGSNIIVHYGKSAEKAQETIAEIRQLGVEADGFSVNLLDPQSIEEFSQEIATNYTLDILVNSAASFVKKTLTDTSLEDWENAMNTNLRAPMLLTQRFAPLLKQGSDGLIVNIADLSGVHIWSNFAAHGVSKAGLIHLTKIAARELAPEIRVNAILPGPILPPPDMDTDNPSWQRMLNNMPLNRSGDPKNIGQTVVFFAENHFVTGAVVNVDGGELLIGPKNH
jgi:NAD(P)-dependent dehydrogenase (short-subunit alcohol dehydrogenase family)